MVTTAVRGLGVPLFALATIAAVYAIVRLWTSGRRDAVIWMLSTFAPYVVIIGRGRVFEWYLPFLFPPLLLLAAYGCVDAVTRASRVPRRAILASIAAVIAATLWHTVGMLRYFTEDPRDAAEAWIAEHVPAGSTVAVVGSELALPDGRYRLRTLPNVAGCVNHMVGRDRLMASAPYRAVRDGILRLERWSAEHLRTRARPEPYRAWFDYLAETCVQRSRALAGVATADSGWPEFVVAVGAVPSPPLEAQGGPDSSYARVARFEPPEPGREPPIEFVGTPVTVFRRSARRT
jgi:hypothetical protein